MLRRCRAQLAAAEPHADSPAQSAQVAYLLAQAEAAQGHLDASLALIEESGRRYRAIGEHRSALRTNLGRANVLRELGRFEDSLLAGQLIIEALGGAGAQLGAGLDAAGADSEAAYLLAAAEQNVGLSLWHIGRFDEGIAAFTSALARYTAQGDRAGATEVRGNRARVLLARGRVSEATEEFAAVADSFADLGQRAYEAMACGCLAEAQTLAGEYAASLRTIERAEALLDHIDAPIGRYEQLMAAGQAYLALNLLAEAEDRFRDALGMLETTELEVVRALAGWGLSQVLIAGGSFGEGLAALDRTLVQLGEGPSEAQWRARALLERAAALHGLGRLAEAADEARAALAVAEAGGAAIEAVGALVCNARWGHPREAEPLLKSAHDRAEVLGLAPLRAATGQLLGRALLARGELGEARTLLEAAAADIETQRAGLGHERLLARFLGRSGTVLEDLVALELADPGGDTLVALRLADQAKSRSLAELATGLVERGEAGPTGTGETSAASEAVWGDLHATYRELFVAGTTDPARATWLAERAVQLEAEVRRLAPPVTAGMARPGAPPPWSLPDEPVVHYLVLDTEVLALVLSEGKLEVLRQLCDVAEVADLVAKLSRQWDRVRIDGANEARAQRLEAGCRAVLGRLYEALFEPIDAVLGDEMHRPAVAAQPLVIVPHKLLHGIPFAALWDGDGYVADRYRLSTSPSLAVLDRCRARRDERRSGGAFVVGVGDELAPLAGAEATAVAALRSGTTLLRDDEATAERFLEGCTAASVVHVACHGWFRADNPMFSGLRLADRFVLAAEVLEHADLAGATVVLSACDTGRAEVGGGDELLGLVRSFLGAGAATLVASLWPADDRSAAALMTEFHTHLDLAGPSEALRRASATCAACDPTLTTGLRSPWSEPPDHDRKVRDAPSSFVQPSRWDRRCARRARGRIRGDPRVTLGRRRRGGRR